MCKLQKNTNEPKMSDRKAFQEYETDDTVNKLVQKSRDSPFVPIGKWTFDVICVVQSLKKMIVVSISLTQWLQHA